jgi:hypothetical protein
MSGGTEADTFYFIGNFGRDTINDFRANGADIIDLSSRSLTFASLNISAVNGGDDTRITIGQNQITLIDFAAADLRASMFDF